MSLYCEHFSKKNELSTSFGSQDRILPKYGKGVAVFAMFANIFEFVTSLLWYLGIILD